MLVLELISQRIRININTFPYIFSLHITILKTKVVKAIRDMNSKKTIGDNNVATELLKGLGRHDLT